MRNNMFPAVALFVTIILAGCDSIPFVDNTSDYKGASRGRPLEVPPDLTSISTDDAYSVPGGTTYSAYNQDQVKPAEAEKLLPDAENVRYERAGSQRWLVVKAPPEKIWPAVREFWTDLGFAVRVENMQTGVMETEWVDAADLTKDEKGNYLDKFQGWLDKLSSLKNRQKFRTRIDRGGEDEVTEIYMSHRSISDVTDDGKERVRTIYGEIENGYKFEGNKNRSKNQDERAIAEDIDAELLRRLMVKLGIAEKQSRSIIANPVQEKRASMSKATDGMLTLSLNDPFDRAWRRVGLALDRVGFLVEDRNRSQGLFYVRYSDIEADMPDENKKGILDKLKFWGDDEKKEQPKPEPKKDDKGMMDKLKFWESKKEEVAAMQYRIKLERAGDGTEVSVVDKDGKRDRSSTANRILSMLYDQLK